MCPEKPQHVHVLDVDADKGIVTQEYVDGPVPELPPTPTDPLAFYGPIERRLARRLETAAELDSEGKVRFARLRCTAKGFEGIEVKERVPLHVFKLPDDRKVWEMRKILDRLREKLRVEVEKVRKSWD